MPNPFTPTCPTCNYDLTGLFNQGSSATCPECNTQTTFEEAIAPRQPKIKQPLIWLLIFPVSLTTIAWQLMLYTGSRFNDIGDIVAIVFLAVQLFYLPMIVFIFLCKSRYRSSKPSKRKYLFLTLLFAVFSTTLWAVCVSMIGTL